MDLIREFFPDIREKDLEDFATFSKEFISWNEKINCISRKDIPFLESRHILHSLTIQRHLVFPPRSRVLDIGTGGGFPGLPLAIMNPEVEFLLVDSIGKKIKVVNSLIEKLSLKNCRGIHSRVEDIEGEFDFVVSRAVARTGKILNWIRSNKNLHLKKGSKILLLKGGDLKEEMKESGANYSLIPLRELIDLGDFDEKFLVEVRF